MSKGFKISTTALDELAQSLSEQSPSAITAIALSFLEEATPFERFRYYVALPAPTLTTDGERSVEPVLVLVDSIPELTIERLIIPASSTNIGATRQVVRCDLQSDQKAHGYEIALGLLDRSWVEIPLVVGGQLVGKIAADWLDSIADIPETEVVNLEAFARVVSVGLGSSVRVPTPRDLAPIDDFKQIASHGVAPNGSKLEILHQIGTSIIDSTDAAMTAIFQFDPQLGTISKVSESARLPSRLRRKRLPESYRHGQFITGQAWVDDAYRNIPDLESFINRPASNSLIEPDSLDWHREYFKGPIKAAAYFKVRTSASRHMIRVMNTLDVSRRVFEDIDAINASFVVETQLLERLCVQHFSNALLKLQESLLRPAGEATPAAYLAECLGDLQVNAYAVIRIPQVTIDGESAKNNVVRTHRGVSAPVVEEFTRARVEDDSILTRVIDSEIREEGGIRTDFLSLNSLPGPISRGLRSSGWTHVVLLYSRRWGTRVVIIPLVRSKKYSSADLVIEMETEQGLWTDSIARAFSTYFSITGDVPLRTLSAAYSMKAFRYLQHELGEPIATFGSSALSLIEETQQRLRESANGKPITMPVLNRLVSRKARLARSFAEASRVFDGLPLLGQAGAVELEIVSLSSRAIVSAAIQQTRDRFPYSVRRRYSIPSFRVLLSIAPEAVRIRADSARLQQALVILLDNAVKYAMPYAAVDEDNVRSGQSEIAVQVRLENERPLFIVRNFGLAIPNFKEAPDAIFEEYFRGFVDADRGAIPGIGLGLGMAKSIALAHGGSIRVLEHTPTFDNPKRRRTYGWNTAIGLTLGSNDELALGQRLYDPDAN